jgi:hypothetical protein
MYILKLVLPLAGLLMAGQALAHKASQSSTTTAAPARPAASRIDTDPASLLDEMRGRGIQGMSALAATAPVPTAARRNAISARINRRH